MNKVEWELYGETNVDEVTDKTNKGLSGLEKNAQRVSNTFTMSLSSIFLKFLGPMALLQAAISWISSAIEANKQKAADAMDLAVKGESMAVKAETAYLARKYAAEDAVKKEEELAKAADEATTERYLRAGNGIRAMNKLGLMGWLKYGLSSYKDAAQGEDMQQAVRELAREDMKKEVLTGEKGKDFKGPEGFSNVVGVGPSPVLDALTLQLEIQKRMLIELEAVNAQKPKNTDFTKQDEAWKHSIWNPFGTTKIDL